MKGTILVVLITTALLVGAQDSPGLDPELSLEPKQKLEDGTPNGDFKDASPPIGKTTDEFSLESPKAMDLTSLPDTKVDQLAPTPGTVDEAVAATQLTQQDEQLKKKATDSNAAEKEPDAVDGTQMEVMTEEIPPLDVTAAQEVETAIEPSPPASDDSQQSEQKLDTTNIEKPEDMTPTATTTPEILSVLDLVPATTFTPHGTQPLMISTIQPMVPTGTDRDDPEEDFVKPTYADKTAGQDVTTSAPAEEVTSYQPNPKIWKPAAMAMDAHKEKRKQPRDAVDPSIPQMQGDTAADPTAPQMTGHTATNQGQATRMNETAHHGEHAGEGQNANVAPSMKAFLGVSVLALAVAFVQLD